MGLLLKVMVVYEGTGVSRYWKYSIHNSMGSLHYLCMHRRTVHQGTHTHIRDTVPYADIVNIFEKLKNRKLEMWKSSWCAWASAPAHCSWVTAGRQSFSRASQQYQASERLPLLKASRRGYCSCHVQSCLGKRDRVGIGRRSRHVDLVCVLGSFREAWIVPRTPAVHVHRYGASVFFFLAIIHNIIRNTI